MVSDIKICDYNWNIYVCTYISKLIFKIRISCDCVHIPAVNIHHQRNNNVGCKIHTIRQSRIFVSPGCIIKTLTERHFGPWYKCRWLIRKEKQEKKLTNGKNLIWFPIARTALGWYANDRTKETGIKEAERSIAEQWGDIERWRYRFSSWSSKEADGKRECEISAETRTKKEQKQFSSRICLMVPTTCDQPAD